MLSHPKYLVLISQRAGLRKTGQDGARWEYKLGVSVKRSVSFPLDPAHIRLSLALEAVWVPRLYSVTLQEPSVRLTDLCCSLWVELARLRLTVSSRLNDGPEGTTCWGREIGGKDRDLIFCLNPSCSPLPVRI